MPETVMPLVFPSRSSNRCSSHPPCGPIPGTSNMNVQRKLSAARSRGTRHRTPRRRDRRRGADVAPLATGQNVHLGHGRGRAVRTPPPRNEVGFGECLPDLVARRVEGALEDKVPPSESMVVVVRCYPGHSGRGQRRPPALRLCVLRRRGGRRRVARSSPPSAVGMADPIGDLPQRPRPQARGRHCAWRPCSMSRPSPAPGGAWRSGAGSCRMARRGP